MLGLMQFSRPEASALSYRRTGGLLLTYRTRPFAVLWRLLVNLILSEENGQSILLYKRGEKAMSD